MHVHYLIKLDDINHQLDIIFLFQYYSYINCAIYRNAEIIKIFNLDWKIIAILYVNGISSPNLYVEHIDRHVLSQWRSIWRHTMLHQYSTGWLAYRATRHDPGTAREREAEGMKSVKFHRSDFSGWWNTFMKYLAKILCELIFVL